MKAFQFVNPTRIFFGENVIASLPEEINVLGETVLLHYGQGSVKKYGVYDAVMAKLEQTGVNVIELGGVKPNPDFALVEVGIALCKQHGVTGILALGGGSVIDSAKAIAAGVKHPDIENAFVLNLPITEALPLGVVLTIPAAGSESSPSSVVNVEQGRHKRSIRSEALYPRFAFIDPGYFVTLDRYKTACGIADIFSHLLERYFTHTQHVDYTDRLLEASMKTLIHQAPYLMHHLDDVPTRAEIGFVGTLAHNGLLGSGREEDWASHRIEHELSAKYDIAHGAGLAIVFPAWMKHVWEEDPQRFMQFAIRVFDVDYAVAETEKIVLEGIRRFENYLKSLYLPVRLHEAGILSDDFAEMVENCFYKRPDHFGSFKKIYREDMLAILKHAK